MLCPFCGSSDTAVVESRTGRDSVSIRRRRDCVGCHRRFTTYERVEGPVLMVVKKDGRRETFDRQKLANGLRSAFHKRPVSVEEIEALVDVVEREVLRKGKEEIAARSIGSIVLRRLKKVDQVAWLRFASVYLAFEDLSDFEEVINK